jgi:hypothetical protein
VSERNAWRVSPLACSGPTPFNNRHSLAYTNPSSPSHYPTNRARAALAIILGAFESSLGPVSKFVPTSTHFFLAAVVAAIAEPRVTLPALPVSLSKLLGGAGGRARRGAATPSRRR